MCIRDSLQLRRSGLSWWIMPSIVRVGDGGTPKIGGSLKAGMLLCGFENVVS